MTEERTEARFEAVQRHPDYEAALAHQPKVPSMAYVIAAFGMLSFSLLFALVSIAVLVGFDAPFLFKIAWILATGAFVVIGVGLVWKAWQFHNAPIQPFVALVIRTRTEVSSGTNDSSASTTYYVTVQRRDGARTELRAPGSVVGQVAPDDIGVGYRKSNTLVDFRRFTL